MTHASLFTGIGGFDLAAEWMGWRNVFQCEINSYCNRLLIKKFPNTIKHGDIRTTDFTRYRGQIDVLSGGFPCQPYSTAGKRMGSQDARHLWPDMLRAIREIKPPWVVGENVRGLITWNAGLVFDEVQSDLETAGYTVTPFLLPASAINAPHQRFRIWFVAYANGYSGAYIRGSEALHAREEKNDALTGNFGHNGNAPDALCGGQQGQGRPEGSGNTTPYGDGKASWSYNVSRWPTQSPVCGGNDGVPYRVDRLIGLGNAVVPQVVKQIFDAIEAYEDLK